MIKSLADGEDIKFLFELIMEHKHTKKGNIAFPNKLTKKVEEYFKK